MATSGSTSVAATSYDTLKFSWTRSGYSIADNTSTISWTLSLIASSSGYISSSAAKAWSVTVNGTKYSGTNYIGISNNATKTLASGTTVISHNDDGTKTFSYSFSQEFSINFNGWVGTKTGSGSGTLDTIPRKSTLSVSNGVLGTAQTLTVSMKSTSFTHTITYECGSYSGTICTKSTSTSISFTPSLDFAFGAPNGTQVYVSFTIETFNGSTSIGTNTYSIWCDIPDSIIPTLSFTVNDAMGYLSTYGGYIQGKSKFTISITASGTYGSTIKAYKTEADGKTFTDSSFTTEVISNYGVLTIKVTVTDSRGRTATASVDVTVLAYDPPKITAMTVKRCDSDGSSNSSGEYLAVTFSATILPLNTYNTATYKVSYKKVSDSSYTTVTVSSVAGKYTVQDCVYIFAADTSTSYDITLTATDAFASVTKTGSGSSISVLFSALKKGLGWAFGKVAELEGYLEVKFKAWFYDDVQVDGALIASSKATFNSGISVSGGATISGGEHVNGGLTYEIPTKQTDIDEMLTSGKYYMGNNATNKPESANGWLGVRNYGDGNYCYQDYISYTGNAYERWRNAGTWDDWYTRVNSDNMASLMTQNVLWSGGYYMNASQSITLSEAISAQRNGIILVWSAYSGGAIDNNWAHQYISKQIVSLKSGNPHLMTIATEGFGYVATKKVYISDTKITGMDSNQNANQTGSGVTYTNSYWVLRYVIGY